MKNKSKNIVQKVVKDITQNSKKGFTLIELLIAILIVGILAVICLPQYQMAVEKAKATEALPLLKSLYDAQQIYYFNNDTYAKSFDSLVLNIPSWKGKVKYRDSSVMKDTISNDKWSLQIYQEPNYPPVLFLGRISGHYKGAGFITNLSKPFNVICVERVADGIAFKGNPGDYCIKLFHGTLIYEDWNIRDYTIQQF